MIKSLLTNLIKLFFLFLFLLFNTNIIARTIVITNNLQKVPYGKKWVLSTKMTPLVELNENAWYRGRCLMHSYYQIRGW
jgi:hypothetical protein